MADPGVPRGEDANPNLLDLLVIGQFFSERCIKIKKIVLWVGGGGSNICPCRSATNLILLMLNLVPTVFFTAIGFGNINALNS